MKASIAKMIRWLRAKTEAGLLKIAAKSEPEEKARIEAEVAKLRADRDHHESN